MKTRTFQVLSDPCHSWVKVSKPFIKSLFGTYWRKSFSCFSYERGDFVYLEEDHDAITLVHKLKEQCIKPIWKETGSNQLSRVRSYQPLQPI